ncbi:uncharacterized protein LOC128221158 isoform X2 [Mya arenaria]|uniref:uncharacterized protein LOC128221158 isoform X2 n=1 Tax=Mya arenaria TaxID=6604 RepID=UPI0022E840E8|nr:uncharacterized protein LOC128221158 isoform X2 [Mya arenaria]
MNIIRINVRMNVSCITVVLMCCFKGVVCNICGSLSYSKPAFKGRKVTLTYKPIDFSPSEMPIFSYSDDTRWIRVPSAIMSNLTLGVYTTVFDTNLPNTGGLYVKHIQCRINIPLVLQDLSPGCGNIYLRTQNPIAGKNIEIEYYPAQAVVQHPGDYGREWYNESSSMTLTQGLVTEEELPNKVFVLTIHHSNQWTTGQYSVKCTRGTYNNTYTEHVYVEVTVPPSKPFLQSKKIVQECPECLVGILGENLYYHVFCNTSGGTSQSIKIGDVEEEMIRQSNSEDIYINSRIIRKHDHMKTVTCSVSNAAIEQPLTTSAKLYVAFKLKTPELNVPILREGSPAKVTCVSRTARPATNLSLWLDGKFPLSVEHVKTYDNTTRTHTTAITLNNQAKRDWNKKYVSCIASSPLFAGNKTKWQTINCTYPPSTLTMVEPRNQSYLQDIYTLEFSCSLDNYNDFCWISWTKDGLPYANGDGTDRIHKSSVIVFANVSKENNGQTITCSVKCSNFEVKLYKSHVVQLPYRPSVHLSVKDELILNARETTKVTCTAKSLPLSDIVWSVKGDTQIHVCNKSNECEININPGNVNERRNYTCTAYFKFEKYGTSATSSFLAVWRGEGSSLTTHSEGISIEWLVIGLVGLLAVVIILTAIVLARKLFLEENTHEHPSEQQPVQRANVQENEIEELNEDPTYAQVDKTRRTRPETEECKAKGGESRDLMESPRVTTDVNKQGSGSELVYADLDIEHLEKARTLTSRQRETTPTVYDDVDFTRTKSGSNK